MACEVVLERMLQESGKQMGGRTCMMGPDMLADRHSVTDASHNATVTDIALLDREMRVLSET